MKQGQGRKYGSNLEAILGNNNRSVKKYYNYFYKSFVKF